MDDDADKTASEDETPEAHAEADAQPDANGDDALAEAASDLQTDAAEAEKTFDDLAHELDVMRDQLLRAVADADNARKIAEREVKDARLYGATAFARDLLSVTDNLARALAAVTPEMRESMGEAGQTLLEGVEITEKDLHQVLSRQGVTPIPSAPGLKCDAHLHEAVAQIPNPDHEAGVIIETVQQGWRIGERTLRAAMVVVSAGGGGGGSPPAEGGSSSGDDGPSGEPGGVVDTKV